MERALGHLREHPGHGIDTVLGFHLRELNDIGAVRGELAVQEEVYEEDLADHINKVEYFAEEEAIRVEVLRMQIRGEVFDQQFTPVALTVLADHRTIEVQHQHLDPAAFPRFPQVARNVEKDRLEEEGEADPLIVLVILDFVLALDVRGNPRLYQVLTNDPGSIRDREGRVDPAVGVHYVQRYIVDDAVDRVADVLPGRHQQREDDQSDHGGLVVQPEHIVIDAHGVELQQPLHRTEHVEHGGGCASRVYPSFPFSLSRLYLRLSSPYVTHAHAYRCVRSPTGPVTNRIRFVQSPRRDTRRARSSHARQLPCFLVLARVTPTPRWRRRRRRLIGVR